MPVGSYAFSEAVPLFVPVSAMRRLIGLVVVAVFSLGLLAGCGGSGTKARYSDADRPK
jgi:hypothetical protein